MSTSGGYHEYIGGYHEYIVSTMGGVQYIGGICTEHPPMYSSYPPHAS